MLIYAYIVCQLMRVCTGCMGAGYSRAYCKNPEGCCDPPYFQEEGAPQIPYERMVKGALI